MKLTTPAKSFNVTHLAIIAAIVYVIGVLALVIILSPSSCISKSQSLQANTVVLSDGLGHGSGVLFTRGDTTFIWTASHVAKKWERDDGTFRLITVVQGNKRGKAEVLRSGDALAGIDVALLRVVKGDFIGTSTFYRDNIYVGQRIIHCGTPLNQKWNERLILFGRISDTNKLIKGSPLIVPRRLDQADITSFPGCSGGPVIDEDTGGVVGLLVMSSGQPRLAIIEPTRRIRNWAEEHGCLWALDRSIALPESIIALPSDSFLRGLRERSYLETDVHGNIKTIIDENLRIIADAIAEPCIN